MHDFCKVALMFLTGHGIKGRTHAHVEIAHFLTWCIIRTWEAQVAGWGAFSLWPHTSRALMMHLIGKCVISTQIWDLAIIPVRFIWIRENLMYILYGSTSSHTSDRYPVMASSTPFMYTHQSLQNPYKILGVIDFNFSVVTLLDSPIFIRIES